MQNDSGVQKAARNEMREAERRETVYADKRRKTDKGGRVRQTGRI